MSAWREARNDEARRRLLAALPGVFPAAVRLHALGRAFVPALPSRAVASYWRAHPLRADRLARALAARSGAPAGWAWGEAGAGGGAQRGFRAPPAPYREPAFAKGAGFCCICGQAVYRYGWHLDLWGDGRPHVRARWHACCVAAWRLWTGPRDGLALLRRLQKRRCAVTGKRLPRDADVDHAVPLYRVWRDERDRPWPVLLAYWGFPNLRAVERASHRAKSAAEAGERRAVRAALAGSGEAAALQP